MSTVKTESFNLPDWWLQTRKVEYGSFEPMLPRLSYDGSSNYYRFYSIKHAEPTQNGLSYLVEVYDDILIIPIQIQTQPEKYIWLIYVK